MCTTNDSLFSEEAMERYIYKKKKSKSVTTNVLRSNEKSDDLTMRSPCINCREDHPLDSCLRFTNMTLKDRVKFLTKVTVFNVRNQWINDIMRRRVIKGWKVEPKVVVVRQVYMVMCQKGKMLLKRVKGAVKMRSLLQIILLTWRPSQF